MQFSSLLYEVEIYAAIYISQTKTFYFVPTNEAIFGAKIYEWGNNYKHHIIELKSTSLTGYIKFNCSHSCQRFSANDVMNCRRICLLTHWGRVTHTCISKIILIGSDNGLSPCRRQPIIWTNAAILLIGPLGTNFNEIFIKIQIFSFQKFFENVGCEMSAILSRPQCVNDISRVLFIFNVYGLIVILNAILLLLIWLKERSKKSVFRHIICHKFISL